MKNQKQNQFKNIPSVSKLLEEQQIKEAVAQYGHDLTVHCIRKTLDSLRANLKNTHDEPSGSNIIEKVITQVKAMADGGLKSVINGTGIILHTNLGRAPLGPELLAEIAPIITGYSNVEYNLEEAVRGDRNRSISELLRFVTGAEDAIIVNNNAAGIMLALMTLAKDKEVIVSRGELIEIGGSFRIPDIMAASGAVMREIGTTNKTRITDYEKAINAQTAMIFKAHKSNYAIKGFTEEVSIEELARLAKNKGLPFLYDIGSGLLKKPEGLPLDNEPDVKSALSAGADLVLFSCDKLLGGPQAGIIAGKKALVSQLASAPMMRALRVDKITLAAASAACRCYIDEARLKKLPLFKMLTRSQAELTELAQKLGSLITAPEVSVNIMDSKGQCGGGTLPELELKSVALTIRPTGPLNPLKGTLKKDEFSERLFNRLLDCQRPIIGVLRSGDFCIDMLTIFAEDIEYIAQEITAAIEKIIS